MRVLVVTVVHTPLDARVYHREIAAIREAGHDVVYVAPWSAYDVEEPREISTVDVPRATGRRRLAALLAARRAVRRLLPAVDIVLIHDPELLVATAGLGGEVPIVWDVHEDTGGAVVDKPWLPEWARPLVRVLVRGAERLAERTRHLTLAETAYQDRFRRPHPLVPNTSRVPEDVPLPGDDRVVYLGRVSRLRGAAELVAVGRALQGEGVAVEVIGQADSDVQPMLRQAHDEGAIVWHGFVPNDVALERVEGAMAGLSLLADEPNYRVSLPTKVLEYAARGIPVITTPLPPAVEVVERYDSGIVVPFGGVDATVAAVLALRDDPDRRRALGRNGHEAVLAHHNWNVDGPAFVRQLETWAR